MKVGRKAFSRRFSWRSSERGSIADESSRMDGTPNASNSISMRFYGTDGGYSDSNDENDICSIEQFYSESFSEDLSDDVAGMYVTDSHSSSQLSNDSFRRRQFGAPPAIMHSLSGEESDSNRMEVTSNTLGEDKATTDCVAVGSASASSESRASSKQHPNLSVYTHTADTKLSRKDQPSFPHTYSLPSSPSAKGSSGDSSMMSPVSYCYDEASLTTGSSASSKFSRSSLTSATREMRKKMTNNPFARKGFKSFETTDLFAELANAAPHSKEKTKIAEILFARMQKKGRDSRDDDSSVNLGIEVSEMNGIAMNEKTCSPRASSQEEALSNPAMNHFASFDLLDPMKTSGEDPIDGISIHLDSESNEQISFTSARTSPRPLVKDHTDVPNNVNNEEEEVALVVHDPVKSGRENCDQGSIVDNNSNADSSRGKRLPPVSRSSKSVLRNGFRSDEEKRKIIKEPREDKIDGGEDPDDEASDFSKGGRSKRFGAMLARFNRTAGKTKDQSVNYDESGLLHDSDSNRKQKTPVNGANREKEKRNDVKKETPLKQKFFNENVDAAEEGVVAPYKFPWGFKRQRGEIGTPTRQKSASSAVQTKESKWDDYENANSTCVEGLDTEILALAANTAPDENHSSQPLSESDDVSKKTLFSPVGSFTKRMSIWVDRQKRPTKTELQAITEGTGSNCSAIDETKAEHGEKPQDGKSTSNEKYSAEGEGHTKRTDKKGSTATKDKSDKKQDSNHKKHRLQILSQKPVKDANAVKDEAVPKLRQESTVPKGKSSVRNASPSRERSSKKRGTMTDDGKPKRQKSRERMKSDEEGTPTVHRSKSPGRKMEGKGSTTTHEKDRRRKSPERKADRKPEERETKATDGKSRRHKSTERKSEEKEKGKKERQKSPERKGEEKRTRMAHGKEERQVSPEGKSEGNGALRTARGKTERHTSAERKLEELGMNKAHGKPERQKSPERKSEEKKKRSNREKPERHTSQESKLEEKETKTVHGKQDRHKSPESKLEEKEKITAQVKPERSKSQERKSESKAAANQENREKLKSPGLKSEEQETTARGKKGQHLKSPELKSEGNETPMAHGKAKRQKSPERKSEEKDSWAAHGKPKWPMSPERKSKENGTSTAHAKSQRWMSPERKLEGTETRMALGKSQGPLSPTSVKRAATRTPPAEGRDAASKLSRWHRPEVSRDTAQNENNVNVDATSGRADSAAVASSAELAITEAAISAILADWEETKEDAVDNEMKQQNAGNEIKKQNAGNETKKQNAGKSTTVKKSKEERQAATSPKSAVNMVSSDRKREHAAAPLNSKATISKDGEPADKKTAPRGRSRRHLFPDGVEETAEGEHFPATETPVKLPQTLTTGSQGRGDLGEQMPLLKEQTANDSESAAGMQVWSLANVIGLGSIGAVCCAADISALLSGGCCQPKVEPEFVIEDNQETVDRQEVQVQKPVVRKAIVRNIGIAKSREGRTAARAAGHKTPERKRDLKSTLMASTKAHGRRSRSRSRTPVSVRWLDNSESAAEGLDGSIQAPLHSETVTVLGDNDETTDNEHTHVDSGSAGRTSMTNAGGFSTIRAALSTFLSDGKGAKEEFAASKGVKNQETDETECELPSDRKTHGRQGDVAPNKEDKQSATDGGNAKENTLEDDRSMSSHKRDRSRTPRRKKVTVLDNPEASTQIEEEAPQENEELVLLEEDTFQASPFLLGSCLGLGSQGEANSGWNCMSNAATDESTMPQSATATDWEIAEEAATPNTPNRVGFASVIATFLPDDNEIREQPAPSEDNDHHDVVNDMEAGDAAIRSSRVRRHSTVKSKDRSAREQTKKQRAREVDHNTGPERRQSRERKTSRASGTPKPNRLEEKHERSITKEASDANAEVPAEERQDVSQPPPSFLGSLLGLGGNGELGWNFMSDTKTNELPEPHSSPAESEQGKTDRTDLRREDVALTPKIESHPLPKDYGSAKKGQSDHAYKKAKKARNSSAARTRGKKPTVE